jgi:hypothetical protein
VVYFVGVTASIPFVPWKPDPIRAYFVPLAFSNPASMFLLHSFFSDLIIPKCIASSFVVISLPSRYHLYSSFVVVYCIFLFSLDESYNDVALRIFL